MRKLTTIATAIALAAGASLVGTSSANAADATVTVVHGVPLDAAAVVDVWANGSLIIDNFAYQDIKTLTVPAGDYDLAVTAPNATDASSPILQASGVAVASGGNYSVVAHLDADGAPMLTAFANPTAATDPGSAMLVVRHTAAAPAVDVRANGQVIAADLANSGTREASLMVPAGTYNVDVVLAGTDTVAIGPVNDLSLSAGMTYIAYAVGNAEKGYTILLQSYETGATAGAAVPAAVPAGEGPVQTMPVATYLAVAVLALATLALGFAAVRRVATVRPRSDR